MIVPDDLPDPEMYYLYVFDANGYHNGKVEVLPGNLEDTFHTVILQAKDEGRKVIVTDEWDNCMFHMENGEVIFPKSR
jgi:hypothetical protein